MQNSERTCLGRDAIWRRQVIQLEKIEGYNKIRYSGFYLNSNKGVHFLISQFC